MHRPRLAIFVLPVLLAAAVRSQESRPPWRAEVRVVDETGQPVAGVAVRARLPFAVPFTPAAQQDFEARTDAAGVAGFRDLPPAAAVVFEATDDAWVPTRSPVVLPRAPEDGAAAAATEMVLTHGRTAEVAVRDAFGAPLEDAVVRVLPLVEARITRGGRGTDSGGAAAASIRMGRVDGVGRTRFEKLPAELLTVEARAPGFEARLATVDLRRAPSAETVIRLDRDREPPGESMPWLGSVHLAFAAADLAAVPVLIAMTMDGERANDLLAARHFRDAELIRVAELLPCLVASVFGEGGVRANDVEHGEVEGLCSRYGSIPCAAHQAVEAWARAEFLSDTPSFHVPRHILVAPDGRVLAHREYWLSDRDLRWMMLRAIRDCGSDAAEWTCLRRLDPIWRALCAAEATEERQAAVEAFARLVDSGDEDAATLLRGFAVEAMPAAVRLQILDAILVGAFSDPARLLEGFLIGTDPAVRTRAWQRLAAHPDRIDCEVAADALAYEDDDSVLAAALRALRVEEHGESLVVADADQGERWRVVEVLLGRVEASALKGVDAIIDQVGTEGRNRILRALAQNPDDESALRRLFGQASAPDARAVAALRALAGVSGDLAPRVRELFVSQTKSADALVRQEAVTQLGRCRASGSFAPIEAALDDQDATVRLAAAVTLWHHGDHRAGEVLVGALDDPELGGEVRSLLEGAYSDAVPADADAWRRWLNGRKAK
jgi:HEAT repeats